MSSRHNRPRQPDDGSTKPGGESLLNTWFKPSLVKAHEEEIRSKADEVIRSRA